MFFLIHEVIYYFFEMETKYLKVCVDLKLSRPRLVS